MIPRKDWFRCAWETRLSEKIRRITGCFDVIDRRIGHHLGGIQLKSGDSQRSYVHGRVW